MDEEIFLRKAEELLRDYNNLRKKVLNKIIDNSERRSAAFKLKKIHNALSVLSDDEVLLIKRRYFENKSWYSITKTSGYKSRSYKGIQNKCTRALKVIAPSLLPYEYLLMGGDNVFNRYS